MNDVNEERHYVPDEEANQGKVKFNALHVHQIGADVHRKFTDMKFREMPATLNDFIAQTMALFTTHLVVQINDEKSSVKRTFKIQCLKSIQQDLNEYIKSQEADH